MNIADLLNALSRPAAYPFPVDEVEVHQTHISVVFLAGDFAYKIKKPVNLGFVDFSTLEKRRHFCDEEVRLNRRLAPHVYVGVVPVVSTEAGVKVDCDGPLVDWAVKMRRLPAEAALENQLLAGRVDEALVRRLAGRIAQFHDAADTNESIASCGRFAVVAQNARDNFTQAAEQVGAAVSPSVFARLRTLTEEWLARLRPLIESRASRDVPRDTHGDLHLDHVYLFPEHAPPDDLVIIDCIEFSNRFRFADPVADMAFLYMDLRFHDRRDLADAFADAYFAVLGSADDEARALLPFYSAYRAMVRAKVDGMQAIEPEVPADKKEQARGKARAHWLLALGELEAPSLRPALVLVGGLPGSGKSTLARGLATLAHFTVIRSDEVRKELAGLPVDEPSPLHMRHALYAPEFTQRTYAECLRRAEVELFEGRRVLLDANFRAEWQRRLFLDAAARWAVPAAFLVCQAAPEVARQRLSLRAGDASDADWSVRERFTLDWAAPGPQTRHHLHALDGNGHPDQVLAQASAVLRAGGLW